MVTIPCTALRPFSQLKLNKYGELERLLLKVDSAKLSDPAEYEKICSEVAAKMKLTVPTFDAGKVRNVQPAKVKFGIVYMDGFKAIVDVNVSGSHEVLKYHASDGSRPGARDSMIKIPDSNGVMSVPVEYLRNEDSAARTMVHIPLTHTYQLIHLLSQDIHNWNSVVDGLVRRHLNELIPTS